MSGELVLFSAVVCDIVSGCSHLLCFCLFLHLVNRSFSCLCEILCYRRKVVYGPSFFPILVFPHPSVLRHCGAETIIWAILLEGLPTHITGLFLISPMSTVSSESGSPFKNCPDPPPIHLPVHLTCIALFLFLRYNISTVEFNGWDPAVNSDLERLQGNDVRVFRDNNNQVDQQVPISELDVYSQFGFDFEMAKAVSSSSYLSCRIWQFGNCGTC